MDNNILERINRSTFKFLEPLSSEEVYKTIVDEAIKLVKARYGTVLLEKDGKLVRVYSSSSILYKVNIRPNGLSYKTFRTQRPNVVAFQEIAKIHPLIKKMGAKSSIYIPLSYKKKSIGVLIVGSRKAQTFTRKELDILALFGSMASLAIRKTQLYEETRQALDVRDHFISMAAHELRTPLTTITGYIQLLYSKLSGGNNSESKWTEQLLYESQRLSMLVKELLDINRIKAGQLDYFLKECDLKEIAHRAMNNFRFNHPTRQVLLENKIAEKDLLVVGDFDKLLQVISNLLDNAAKFSSDSSPVVVHLRSKQNCYIIEVSDEGKGIRGEDLPKVFQPFYKEEGNLKTGMGLGLHLAKHIIDYHKGEIKVNSIKNKGTVVEVELPKAIS